MTVVRSITSAPSDEKYNMLRDALFKEHTHTMSDVEGLSDLKERYEQLKEKVDHIITILHNLSESIGSFNLEEKNVQAN